MSYERGWAQGKVEEDLYSYLVYDEKYLREFVIWLDTAMFVDRQSVTKPLEQYVNEWAKTAKGEAFLEKQMNILIEEARDR